MNPDWQLIVTPFEQRNTDGLVKAVFFIDNEDQIRKINNPDWNRIIWISSGYEDIITRYQNGDFFILTKVSETDKENDYSPTSPHSRADYWATSQVVKHIEESKMVPIINTSLPDKSSGIMDYVGTLPRGQFFISHDHYAYGPFHAVVENGVTIAEPHTQTALNLKHLFVAKLPISSLQESYLLVNPNDDEVELCSSYITSLKGVNSQLRQEIVQEDFINDGQLVSYLAKQRIRGNKRVLSKQAAEQVRTILSAEAKKNQLIKEDPRLSRLGDVLDKFMKSTEHNKDLIDDWLDSDKGKAFLFGYIEQNPGFTKHTPADFSEHKEVLNSLEADKQRLESEISGLDAKRRQIKDNFANEIRIQKEELAKRFEQDEKEGLEKRSQEIKALDSDIKEKTKQLNNLLNELSLAHDVQALEGTINTLDRQKQMLVRAVEHNSEKLRSSKFPEEIAHLHVMMDLLQGRSAQEHVEIEYKPCSVTTNESIAPESIIKSLASTFQDNGRPHSFDEMANLVIVVQQSLMTVLKGRPGSGKTSTAIHLAEAHKITDEAHKSDDFLNVPVSRGWVSGRDFMGFYNGIKGKYQPSRTGVYQFLKNGEDQPVQEQSIRLALLDEANLSPMEHYLSDMIGMFDPEGRNRVIQTGSPFADSMHLSVPENVRFIATINSDGTTEQLSPRMCDRVPVITMDFQDSESSDDFSIDGLLDEAIPHALLEKHFGNPEEARSLGVKLNAIISIMTKNDHSHGGIIPVSQRKKNAITRYHTVACKFMEDTVATDFAICQFLLPLINGAGKGFGKRLKALYDQFESNGYNRSKFTLGEIIALGEENIDNYSYF